VSLLSALIQKRETRKAATAIPAISATQPNEGAVTVARIATVAVANPTDAKTADAVISWGWLLHFADREPLEVYCNPDATHAEILERYPDALAAEPISERIAPPEAEAIAWPSLKTTEDDRRTCYQCANLIARQCQAAKRGEIVANREYEPVRDLPRRCEGYMPRLMGADGQPQVYCKDLRRDLEGARDGKEM
jgi:hypothetical protein